MIGCPSLGPAGEQQRGVGAGIARCCHQSRKLQTKALHCRQEWRVQAGRPRRKATQALMETSSRRRPRDDMTLYMLERSSV